MESNKDTIFSLTNILVMIALAINAIVFMQLGSIDNKMFVHLTNASLHVPRESVVSRDEFVVYQTMRDRQVSDLKEIVCETRELVKMLADKKGR